MALTPLSQVAGGGPVRLTPLSQTSGGAGGVKLAPMSQAKSPITGQKTPTAAALLAQAKAATRKRSWFSRLVSGVGSDAVDIVTSVPGTVKLVGQAASGVGAGVLGRGLWLVGQGDSSLGRSVKGYRKRMEDVSERAVKGTIEDYKRTYGPLFRGDFGQFGENFLEHPLFITLDAAGAYGVAGKAVNASSRAARGAGLTRPGGAVERLAARGADSPHMQKPPKARYLGLSDEETGVIGTAVAVPRGIYSRNPITREFIQKPTQRARDRAGDWLWDHAGGLDSKAERVMRRQAEDVATKWRDRAVADTEASTETFADAIRGLDRSFRARFQGKNKRVERDAVMLHAVGLLGFGERVTGRAAMDAVIDRLEAGVEASTEQGKRTKMSRAQIERYRQIPDELLDYDTLPDQLREAVDAARATISDSQAKSVRAGFITQDTAQAVPGRAARELVGGEEDVRGLGQTKKGDRVGLLSEEAVRRIEELDEQIDWANRNVAFLKSPMPRAERVRLVREARRQLKRAEKYKTTRVRAANDAIARAEGALARIANPGARIPNPRGDALISTDGRAGLVRDLDRYRERAAAIDAVVRPGIHESAVGLITSSREKVSVAGKRKAKLRFRSAEHHYGRVEDDVRTLAASGAPDARSLADFLGDESPVGPVPTAAGRKRALSEKQIVRRAEASLAKEGVTRPAHRAKPVSATGKHDVGAAGRRQKVWEDYQKNKVAPYEERLAARVAEIRAADHEAMRALSPTEIGEAIKKEMSGAGRGKKENAAGRIAALVGNRVPTLEFLRDTYRQRLMEVAAREAKDPSPANRRATSLAARQAAIADEAYRVGVERRLRDAEPGVRAEAISRGLISEDAPSTNPRVVASLLDERDRVHDEVRRLEDELGLRDQDVDALFDDGVGSGGEVERRSAREVREENTRRVHAPREEGMSRRQLAAEIKELEAKGIHVTGEEYARLREARGERGRRRLFDQMFRDEGPVAQAVQAIEDANLDKAAVRAGYQPREITEQVARLSEEVVEREKELAVARNSEIGSRTDVDAAKAEAKRLREMRKLVSNPKAVDRRIAALERKGESGKITDDEYLELVDLREVRSPDRSSPVPVEYADVIPTVREYMRDVRARIRAGDDAPELPEMLSVSPNVDMHPPVVEAAARTSAAIDRAAAAVVDGKGVERAFRDVEQAYFLEREARINAVRDVEGIEWVDAPEAQHLPAVPADKLSGSGGTPYQSARGRITREKAKRGTGTMRRSGNFQVVENMVMEQAARASMMAVHPSLVKEMIDTFAARTKGGSGKIVRGNRVLAVMRSDPDRYTPISATALDGLFGKSRQLAEGDWLDAGVVNDVLRGDGSQLVVKRKEGGYAFAHGVTPQDVVLIPKEVAKGWADATKPKRLKGFDTVMDNWKAGMLALHPRWYVYNLVGNTLQFGIMSLGDIRSIVETKRHRKRIQAALGEAGQDVHRASLARDMALDPGLSPGMYKRITDFGFRLNDRFEGFLRDAAMWSATKRELRLSDRSSVRSRRASVDAIEDALSDIRPDSPILAEAARTAKLFMGDYRRFSPLERTVFRRIFPFYSWLRVISKLTLSLPVKHPTRTALMSVMAQAYYNSLTPEEYALEKLRPVYDRGGIGVGPFTLRTTSMNPFATVAPYVEAVGNRSLNEGISALAPSMNPLATPVMQAAYGRSALGGRDFSSPIGHDGAFSVFGSDELRINPVTGSVETAPPARPSLLEGFSQSLLPFYGAVGRRAVSWGERPYDTASTPTILFNRAFGWGDRDRIFKPESKTPRVSTPVGPGGLVSIAAGEAGFPITRRDEDAELALRLKLWEKYRKARISTEKKMKAGG